MEWISVKDRLPELDVEVLGFYTIPKNKQDKGMYLYYTIVRLESKTERKGGISVNFIDSEYNPFDITHWMPLKPPINESTDKK